MLYLCPSSLLKESWASLQGREEPLVLPVTVMRDGSHGSFCTKNQFYQLLVAMCSFVGIWSTLLAVISTLTNDYTDLWACPPPLSAPLVPLLLRMPSITPSLVQRS